MARICIIPARGGSRRIQKKNIREFMGQPIIAYPIKTARESTLFDEIYVSTESDEIGEVAMHYGAKMLGREYEEAQDHIGTQEVMRGAIKRIWTQRITEVCCIYATTPMMTKQDLRRGYDALKRHTHIEYAFAVIEEPFGPAGMFYWGRATAFATGLPLVAEHSVIVPVPSSRAIDINTEQDWTKAEEMYTAWIENRKLAA